VSVFIPIPITEVEEFVPSPSRTYKLDLENGRILSAGSCDEIEAVEQFVKKALITPRFRCAIYDNQYGSELKQAIIASNVTPEYIQTELPEYTKDAVLSDGRVLDLYGFSIELRNESALISCNAITTYGETTIEEVL